MQKHQCYNLKKNKSFDQKKRLISTYVASVIGALQCLEQQLFYMMDQAEQSSTNSMIQVVGQLTNFIEVRIIFYYILTYSSFDLCKAQYSNN